MYNCVIATMNSNESDVNEWLVYNILLGFEHIYIYDDGSNPKMSDIISELPKNIRNCVTIYRLDSHYEIMKGEYNDKEKSNLLYFDEEIYKKHKDNKQRYLMNYFIKHHKKLTKYCFFCDIDEFIYLKNDNTIYEYLNKMKEHDIIYIPWVYYGTSYYIDKPKGLVIDNFRCHKYFYDCGKSIVNITNVNEILCIHTIDSSNSKFFSYDKALNRHIYNIPLFTLPIHINHYITKSYKTLVKKKKEHCLGQTNNFQRTISYIVFMGMGLNEIKSDHIMQKHVKKVNSILKYELNDKHNDYDAYLDEIVCDNNKLTTMYVNKNNNIKLLEDILKSNNIYYKKK
jgi:hypothetical protein